MTWKHSLLIALAACAMLVLCYLLSFFTIALSTAFSGEVSKWQYELLVDWRWESSAEVKRAIDEAMDDDVVTQHEFDKIEELVEQTRFADAKGELRGFAEKRKHDAGT